MDTSEPSGPKPLYVRRAAAGFSLVEVTLAIGIMAFGFLSVVGLLPTGLNVLRQAIDTTTGASITQQIMSDAQQTDFAALTLAANATTERYFNDQGIETGTPAGSIYQVRTVIAATTTLPTGASTANLATVTIQIVNNPGHRPVTTDPVTKLWSDSRFAITTYSGFVSRAK